MNRFFLIVFTILMLAFSYWAASPFRQERGKIKYTNPKYIRDVQVFTGRKSRHDPYLTNMTGTVLVPYGNNVSVGMTLIMQSGGDFRIVVKVCDSIKAKWMNDWMSSFTNVSLSKCPIAPGSYMFYNMELPPKNIPIPLADGDYTLKYELFVTATKETILDALLTLHFDQNAKGSKGKKG